MKLVFFTSPKATTIPKITVAKSGQMVANSSLVEALQNLTPIVPGDSATIAFDEESENFFLCHWPDGNDAMPKVSTKGSTKAREANAVTFHSTLVSNGLLAKIGDKDSGRTLHFSVNLTPVEGHALEKAQVYALKLMTAESLGMEDGVSDSTQGLVQNQGGEAKGANEPPVDIADNSKGLEGQELNTAGSESETKPANDLTGGAKSDAAKTSEQRITEPEITTARKKPGPKKGSKPTKDTKSKKTVAV